MKRIDNPFAVVVLWKDGSGASIMERDSAIEAEMGARGFRMLGHEAHVVALPDLLAWVRANAREGT